MNLATRENKLRNYFKSLGIYEYELISPEGLAVITNIQSYAKKIAQVLNLGDRTPYKLLPNHSYLKQLEPYLQFCTNRLFDTTNYNWQLHELEVMRSGKSYPLKCTLYTPNLGTNETIYVKNYNLTESARPFGILMFNYSSKAYRNYHYILSDNILIENHIHGTQPPFNSPIYKRHVYKLGLIEFTMSSLRIGLKDMEIFDQTYIAPPMNYTVNKRGIHIPIDFEYLTSYSLEDTIGLHNLTQLRLNMSFKEYVKYAHYVHSRYHTPFNINQEAIIQLLNIIPLLTPPHFNNKHYFEYQAFIKQQISSPLELGQP